MIASATTKLPGFDQRSKITIPPGLFWIPLIGGLLIFSLDSNPKWLLGSYFHIVVLYLSIHMGHVLPTFLLVRRAQKNNPEGKYIFRGLVILSLLGSAYFFSEKLFYSIAAYWTIYHLARQQWGFVCMSYRNTMNAKRERLLDGLFISSMVLLTLLYWHSTSFPHDKIMFHSDLIFRAPLLTQSGSVGLALGASLLYIFLKAVSYLRSGRLNVTSLNISLATAVWFTAPIIFLESPACFFLCAGWIHGLAYHFHIHELLFNGERRETAFLSRIPKIPIWVQHSLFALGLGILMKGISVISDDYIRQIVPIMSIPWTLVLLHYYYDSVIWKKGQFRFLKS